MITRKYYEKNAGYQHVLDALRKELGEDITASIVNESVSKCNAL